MCSFHAIHGNFIHFHTPLNRNVLLFVCWVRFTQLPIKIKLAHRMNWCFCPFSARIIPCFIFISEMLYFPFHLVNCIIVGEMHEWPNNQSDRRKDGNLLKPRQTIQWIEEYSVCVSGFMFCCFIGLSIVIKLSNPKNAYVLSDSSARCALNPVIKSDWRIFISAEVIFNWLSSLDRARIHVIRSHCRWVCSFIGIANVSSVFPNEFYVQVSFNFWPFAFIFSFDVNVLTRVDN